jgi:putative addiction module component (TIGR02574 family)
MSEVTEKLLSVVRALPEVEQREFAAALNGALMPDDEDPELAAELERRWQGYLSGERPGVTAEEFAREVEARYGKRP